MRRRCGWLLGCGLVLLPMFAAADSTPAVPGSAAQPAADWETVANSQGVTIAQREQPGALAPLLRGTLEIAAPLHDVVPVLIDVAHHTKWMPDCSEARLVGKQGTTNYVYNRSQLPWPVSDRDVLVASHVIVVAPGVEVDTVFESSDEKLVPPVSGVVRMSLLRGRYRLRALAPDRTSVELQIEMHPGGSVPAFVVRRIGRDSALHTLVALRDQVLKTRGQYAAFMTEWLAKGDYERPTGAAAPDDSGAPASSSAPQKPAPVR